MNLLFINTKNVQYSGVKKRKFENAYALYVIFNFMVVPNPYQIGTSCLKCVQYNVSIYLETFTRYYIVYMSLKSSAHLQIGELAVCTNNRTRGQSIARLKLP